MELYVTPQACAEMATALCLIDVSYGCVCVFGCRCVCVYFVYLTRVLATFIF
jgi:hypothetical protein